MSKFDYLNKSIRNKTFQTFRDCAILLSFGRFNSFRTELKKKTKWRPGRRLKNEENTFCYHAHFLLILNVYIAQSIKYYTSNESLYNSLQFHGILRERKGNNKERIL